jgi:hypothetical protein
MDAPGYLWQGERKGLYNMPEVGFHPAEPVTAEGPDSRTFCAVHPNIETSLRCNKCGRYMCSKCAVRTPVGYRCRECVHQQQDIFFSATQRDYVIAAIVSLVLSVPISYILPKIFLLGVILFSIPAGGLIGEVVFRAMGRRRGRYTWAVVAGGIIAGAVVASIPIIQFSLAVIDRANALDMSPATVLGGQLLMPLLYLALCVGGAIARLRYGK